MLLPLRKFLLNAEVSISIPANLSTGGSNPIIFLADREYRVPDFQREIRWDSNQALQLISDIATGPQYLGNVILTKPSESNYFWVIDGQQRMTTLIMILHCAHHLHGNAIDILFPCSLQIESFKGFTSLLNDKFSSQSQRSPEIIETDDLNQISQYYELWDAISTSEVITGRISARQFLQNLENCTFNVLLSNSDNPNQSVRYFIDVNLKGKQLDTEDIFKGYLFQNDSASTIRAQWYLLKKNDALLQAAKIKYPMLKLMEHYFLCSLESTSIYSGLSFDSEFLLTKKFKNQDGTEFPAQTHLIEVINDKAYMLQSVTNINSIISILLNIVQNSASNTAFRQCMSFVKLDGYAGYLDEDELAVIFNFMSKILKEDQQMPKALLVKYFLSIQKSAPRKKDVRNIYGVYLASVLFGLLESNKEKSSIMSILSADNEHWYVALLEKVNNYWDVDQLTNRKLTAQFKHIAGETDIDYRFRCKSIATLYNFFRIKGNEVILNGHMSDIRKYLIDTDAFTCEHFIVSEASSRSMVISATECYQYSPAFYKKYSNGLFNFIFIPREINKQLGDNWLPAKLEILEEQSIACAYSTMVIASVANIGNHMKAFSKRYENTFEGLTLYFGQNFHDDYLLYARHILDATLAKIKEVP